jgi:hypothetical protein
MKKTVTKKRAQAATEFLIILAAALVVLLVILEVSTETLSSAGSEIRHRKAQNAIDEIADAAELVYQQGVGAKTKVYVSFPNTINTVSITDQTIAITFKGTGQDPVYRNVGFSLNGSIPSDEGFYWITVEAKESVVDISTSFTSTTQTSPPAGPDTTPPGPVTSLINQSAGDSWIYWTWTNPSDSDFNSAIIYLDGTNVVNTSNTFYNSTGLTNETEYTVTIHTKDNTENVNTADVIRTGKTTTPQASTTVLIHLSTQTCSAESAAAKGSFAQSCDGNYPTECDDGDDDLLSCDDTYTETHDATKDGPTRNYAGLRISTFNSSITDCSTITAVQICYEWWTTDTLQDCDISVDADGGSSPTATTTTCPGTSANPGVTCSDVTVTESWTCSNFFGASGTRAQIKSEAQHAGSSESKTVTWDALYYNVTYETN